jgi:RNA polymerase sigma factor (sigma-70 family)
MNSRISAARPIGAPSDLEPNRQLEQADHSAAVTRAMRRLPERYARILEWKYGDDLPVQEISRMLGVTAVAAQSLLARAREAFRDECLMEKETDASSLSQRPGVAHD